MEKQNIVIYHNETGKIKVDVRFEDEEFDRRSTVRNFRTVQIESTREV